MASPVANALQIALNDRKPATRAAAAPAVAPGQPVPETVKDALTLRKYASPGSALAPVAHVAKIADGAANDDDFGIVSGLSDLLAQLRPALSKGIIGTGLNVLVVGAGTRGVVERHVELGRELEGVANPSKWSFNGVYRLTSLLQQVAVFWRTMGNAAFKIGMWTLGLASRLPLVSGPARAALGGIEALAATPFGRTLGFLNKWVPLLNAAWILMAMKSSWDTFHDPKSSATSKTVSVLGVATSTAAVLAGLYMGGLAFIGVTALSIFSDLLLVETRFRDMRHGDADKIAVQYMTHPWEAVAASGRWMGRVGQAIGAHVNGLLDGFFGKKKAAPAKPKPATPPQIKVQG